MMKQFDFNRFKSLVCWTMTMDKRHYIKTVLSWMVIMSLMFLFFTCVVNFDNKTGGLRPYQPCGLMVIMMVGVILTMGPAFMFTSMKGRIDDQRLLMLPASNLEKYLMRYLSWVMMLPLCVVALVCADVVQWLVNIMLRHDHAMFVMQWLAEMPKHLHMVFGPVPGGLRQLLLAFAILTLWVHSLYAVGATLFRSHKYNWVLTSIAINIGIVLLAGIAGSWGDINVLWWNRVGLFNILFVILSVFNFWLSYKIFCRTQLIGKYINL